MACSEISKGEKIFFGVHMKFVQFMDINTVWEVWGRKIFDFQFGYLKGERTKESVPIKFGYGKRSAWESEIPFRLLLKKQTNIQTRKKNNK